VVAVALATKIARNNEMFAAAHESAHKADTSIVLSDVRLSEVRRTWGEGASMSAFDPKRALRSATFSQTRPLVSRLGGPTLRSLC
jgi:hypothetical protein